MINITVCKEINDGQRERIKTIQIDTKVPFKKMIQFLIQVSGYKEEDVISVSFYRNFDQQNSLLFSLNHELFSCIGDQGFDRDLSALRLSPTLFLFCSINVAKKARPLLVWPCPQKIHVVEPEKMNNEFLRNMVIAEEFIQELRNESREKAEVELQRSKQEIKKISDQDYPIIQQKLLTFLRYIPQIFAEDQILASLFPGAQITVGGGEMYFIPPPQFTFKDQESLLPPTPSNKNLADAVGAAMSNAALPTQQNLTSQVHPSRTNDKTQQERLISNSFTMPIYLVFPLPLAHTSRIRSPEWHRSADRINELLWAYHNQYYFDVLACINLNKPQYEEDIQILKRENGSSDYIKETLEFVEHVLFKIAEAYLRLYNNSGFEFRVSDKYWGLQITYLAMCLTPGGLMYSPPEVKEIEINKLIISGKVRLRDMSQYVEALAIILRCTRELVFDIDELDYGLLDALLAAREKCGNNYAVSKIHFNGICSVTQLKQLLAFVSKIKYFSETRLTDIDVAVHPSADGKITAKAFYCVEVCESHRYQERFVTVHGDIDNASRTALLEALPKSDKTQWDVKVIVAKRTLSMVESGSTSVYQNVLGHVNNYIVPTKCTRLFIEELPLIQIDVNSQQGLSAADNRIDQTGIIVSVSLRNRDSSLRSERMPQPSAFMNALNRLELREVAILHLHGITVSENDFQAMMKFMTTRHDLYVDADRVDCFVCHAITIVAKPICHFSSNDMSIPSEAGLEVLNDRYRCDSFVNDYLSSAILALPQELEKRIYIRNQHYQIYQNLLELILQYHTVSLIISARIQRGALQTFLQALQFNSTLIELRINRGSSSENTNLILERNKRLADRVSAAQALPAKIAAVERILAENNPDILAREHSNILLQVIRITEIYKDSFSDVEDSDQERLDEKLKQELRAQRKSIDIILQRCVALAKRRFDIFSEHLDEWVELLISLRMHNVNIKKAISALYKRFIEQTKPTEPLPISDNRRKEILLKLYNDNAIPASWIIGGSEFYFRCMPWFHRENISTALDLSEAVIKLDAQKGMSMLRYCAKKYTHYFSVLGSDNFIRPPDCVKSLYKIQRLMNDNLRKASSRDISSENVSNISNLLKIITVLLHFHFLPIIRGEYTGSFSAMGFGNRMNPETLKDRLNNAHDNPTLLLQIIDDILKFNAPSLGSEKPAYFKALEELQDNMRYIVEITRGWVFGFVSVAEGTSEENHLPATQAATNDGYVEDKKIYTQLTSSGRLSGPTLFSISAFFYADMLMPLLQKEKMDKHEKAQRAARLSINNAPVSPSDSWFQNEKEFEIAARKLARKR